MAETDVAELKSGKSQKLVLPAIIVTCVLAVLGLFTVGYNTLTTPEPIPSDIREILEKSKLKSATKDLLQLADLYYQSAFKGLAFLSLTNISS